MIRALHIQRKGVMIAMAFVFAVSSILAPWAGLVQSVSAVPEPAPVKVRALTGGNSVALLWEPAVGSTPTQYKVYRNGTLRATLNPSTVNASGVQQRYIDTGVTTATTYSYQVSALNAASEESTLTTALSVTHTATTVPTITLNPAIPANLVGFMNNGKSILQTWYPKFNVKLGSVAGVATSFPMETEPNTGYAAYVPGGEDKIVVDEGWAADNLNNVVALGVFLHEGTHIIQRYTGMSWVVEGVADYMRNFVYGEGTYGTFNNATATWMDGYDNTAAWLNWVSTTYNKPNLVKDLHVSLGTTNPATYNGEWFRTQTGLTVGELWEKMTAKKLSSPMQFKNVAASNKCLDLLNGDTTDFNNFQLQTCVGNQYQQFMWTADSPTSTQGDIRIMKKCLDVYGSGTTDGTKVYIHTCNSSGAQKWIILGNGALKNPNSGKCLRPVANGTAVGTQMEIWTCDGTNNQNWLVRFPGMLKNFAGIGCASGSAVYPAAVTVYSCGDGSSAMSWQYKQATPGATSGTISSRNTGYCLEPLNGSTAANTTMSMVTCDGSAEQNWQWQSNNTVKNMGNNLCLTLPAWASPWQLTQTACAATPPTAQKFDRLYQY
jgi:hypothetical protein